MLSQLNQKPSLFAPGEAQFWTDPHIAKQMLKAHLDPAHDAASRRPAIIGSTVEWIADITGLEAGDALLDLGCGPGLYTQRFSRMGLQVTGVDFSENSIRYAREQDFKTTYLCQDYLTLDFPSQFDVVTMIFGDYCVLSDEDRPKLLRIVHQALKLTGYFVFDVTTYQHHAKRFGVRDWSIAQHGGFWKAQPYLELMNGFHYPEHDSALDQYIIIEDDGKITVYRNWFHYFSSETITVELEAHGFAVEGIFNDLWGTPYREDSEWVGVVAKKN